MSPAASEPAVETTPDPGILAALDAVLGSDLFADVPRLSRFLSFVVSEEIKGRGDRRKGFVIACEVFDKTDPSDAQTTTIVRVEAGRLRRRLDDYYQGQGSTDPLRISIPKGGYKPIFEQREIEPANADYPPLPVAPQGRGNNDDHAGAFSPASVAGLIAVIVVVFALAAAYYYYSSDSQGPGSPSSPIDLPPTIAVLPLESFNENQLHSGLGLEITESLISSLSKQPNLQVMALSSTEYFRSKVDSVRDIAREMQVSHVIKGGFSGTRDVLRVTIGLHEARSGYVIWSDEFAIDRSHSAQSIIKEIQSAILQQLDLENTLGDTGNALFDPDRHALYTQARNLSHPPANGLRVGLALGIFDTLASAYPNYAGGFAGAAYARSANVWWGHSKSPARDAKRAREDALRALQLDETTGLAYVALGMLEWPLRIERKHCTFYNVLSTCNPVIPWRFRYSP